MPARKIAIRNWRIMDRKSADIKKTSSSNTHLLIVSLFINPFDESGVSP
jgi:hypothetical protein